MNINPVKVSPWLAMAIMLAIGASYFIFLYASWHQFQLDRASREDKIDELLDRLPKPASSTGE